MPIVGASLVCLDQEISRISTQAEKNKKPTSTVVDPMAQTFDNPLGLLILHSSTAIDNPSIFAYPVTSQVRILDIKYDVNTCYSILTKFCFKIQFDVIMKIGEIF